LLHACSRCRTWYSRIHEGYRVSKRERGRGRRSVAASPDNLPRFSARCRRFVLLLGPPPDSFVPTRVPSPFPFPLFSAWDTRSLHPGCEVAGRRRSCDWKNLTRGIKKKGRSGRRDSGVVQIRPDAGKMHSFSSFSFFFLFLRIFLRARARARGRRARVLCPCARNRDCNRAAGGSSCDSSS